MFADTFIVEGEVIESSEDNITISDDEGNIFVVSRSNGGNSDVNVGDNVAVLLPTPKDGLKNAAPEGSPISVVIDNPVVPDPNKPPSPDPSPVPSPPSDPDPTPTPTPTPPNDTRPVIDLSASGPTHAGYSNFCINTGPCYYLDQPNTIYDFKNVPASRDIRIAASNVEARNIKGSGARRIGAGQYLSNASISGSGFRNFEFTYAQTNHYDHDLIDPYFINGTDVNPDPIYRETNTHFTVVAVRGGNLIRPLIENIEIRSAQLPNGHYYSDGHSHHIECLIISNVIYGYVESPTVRGLNCRNGTITGMIMRFIRGTATIEDSVITRGPDGSADAIQASVDPSGSASIIWKNNAVNGMSAYFSGGWTVNPASGNTGAITISN